MPEVTAATAAVCTLMFVAMSADAAYQRARYQVALQGLGDNKHVNRAVRIHGNFAEYVPMALLQLLLLELLGIPRWALASLGAALVVGRLLHWLGLKMSSGRTIGRLSGVLITWLVLIGEAVALLGTLAAP